MWKSDIPDPRSPARWALTILESSSAAGPYIAAISRSTVADPAPAVDAVCVCGSPRQS